jgi:hypothetical protein
MSEKRPLELHEIRAYLMLVAAVGVLGMSFVAVYVAGVLFGSISFGIGLGLLLLSLGLRNKTSKPNIAKPLMLSGGIVFGIALVLAILFIVSGGKLPF